MKPFGLSLVFSTAERGLWWDSDQHYLPEVGKTKRGFGLVFKLRAGQVVRPIPKNKDTNPWWYPKWVMRFKCPLPILPYFSIAIGEYGWYMGFKEYLFEPHYKPWWPKNYDHTESLAPSFSMRRTRAV